MVPSIAINEDLISLWESKNGASKQHHIYKEFIGFRFG